MAQGEVWPGDHAVERIVSNGLEFETWVAGDPASDRLALLLHGFPEHAISWRYQMPLFAERGYRVWAPNQRGYGESSMPEGRAAYAVEHLIEDVAGLIDAAVQTGFEQNRLRPMEFGGDMGTRAVSACLVDLIGEVDGAGI